MFGRNPRLLIDASLGLVSQERKKSYSTFVDNLRARLAHAYDLASSGIEKKSGNNKRRYDLYARETSLQSGDRVLVRNLTTRGKQTPGSLGRHIVRSSPSCWRTTSVLGAQRWRSTRTSVKSQSVTALRSAVERNQQEQAGNCRPERTIWSTILLNKIII